MLTPEQLKEIASLDTEEQQNAVLADMTKQILDPRDRLKESGLRIKLLHELDCEMHVLNQARQERDYRGFMATLPKLHSIVDKLDCL